MFVCGQYFIAFLLHKWKQKQHKNYMSTSCPRRRGDLDVPKTTWGLNPNLPFPSRPRKLPTYSSTCMWEKVTAVGPPNSCPPATSGWTSHNAPPHNARTVSCHNGPCPLGTPESQLVVFPQPGTKTSRRILKVVACKG